VQARGSIALTQGPSRINPFEMLKLALMGWYPGWYPLRSLLLLRLPKNRGRFRKSAQSRQRRLEGVVINASAITLPHS
jgi:hypothetical protein